MTVDEKDMIEQLVNSESIPYEQRQALEIWLMRDRFPLSPKDCEQLIKWYDELYRYGVE